MDIMHNIKFDTSGQYKRQLHNQMLNEVVSIIPYAETCNSADQFVKTASKMTYNHPNQNDIMWTLFNYFRDKAEKEANPLKQKGFNNLSNILFERTLYRDNMAIPLAPLAEIPVSSQLKKRQMFSLCLDRLIKNGDTLPITTNIPNSWYTLVNQVSNPNKQLLDLGIQTGINFSGEHLQKLLKNDMKNIENISLVEDLANSTNELIFHKWVENEGTNEHKICGQIMDNFFYKEFREDEECLDKNKMISKYKTKEALEDSKISHLKKAIKLIEKHFGEYTLERFVKEIKAFKP